MSHNQKGSETPSGVRSIIPSHCTPAGLVLLIAHRERVAPRQALLVLEQLRIQRDEDDPHQLVFPAPKKPGRWMSEATLNAALRRLGYDTRTQHCQHGFRTTFSTNMHEQGWSPDWIEAQLAHTERNKVRGAYNKASYLEGRREMMQRYADWLDEVARPG